MTRNVLLKIQGMQFLEDDTNQETADNMDNIEKIETLCPAEYYNRNQAHYIMYEEIQDDVKEPIKNMIKVRGNEFILTKKGAVNFQMIFSEGKKTMTEYVTPYGNIMIALDTSKVLVEESQDRINIHIEYILEANYQFVADCHIDIVVRACADKE